MRSCESLPVVSEKCIAETLAGSRRERRTSCKAAIRVKPKARLRAWVMVR